MTRQPAFRRSSPAVLLFLLCAVVPAGTAPSLPEEIHEGILLVNELICGDDLDAAENEAKRIIRKAPDHPAGYFCMAFVIDSWMVRYQSDSKEDEFYRYCDLAIEKGEKILARRNRNEWASFFIGSADGFKGTYEARYERWITAFRYGWKGVSVLMELQKSGSGIPDINFGIGCYNYWRSALMKMLWWMPGVEDRRQEAIELLYKTRREALYCRTATSTALIDILINERKYAEALAIAEEELKKHPTILLFMWGKVRALYGLQQYDTALSLIIPMIRKTELDEYDNHYNTTMYRLYLAKILLAEKKHHQAISECTAINNYAFEPSIRKRLEATLAEVKNIHKLALKGMAAKK
ncbi:MAG: hypothetical protein JXA18_17540 [Chitinispirillaceae bacterium]|nr:hypothetical protein [Chitinispirillaceae bacterium]